MVWRTTRTVASSNYTPEESKKAERSIISVDLLVVGVIWVDQRSKVDCLMMAKIAHSWVVIAKHAQVRRAAAAAQSPIEVRRQWQCKGIDSSPQANELHVALVFDTLNVLIDHLHVWNRNWTVNGTEHIPFKRNGNVIVFMPPTVPCILCVFNHGYLIVCSSFCFHHLLSRDYMYMYT